MLARCGELQFATRVGPRTDATTKATKSTKVEFGEFWNQVIGCARAAYRHFRAGLLESTGQIWKTVSTDSFSDSFVPFVSFVVRNERRLLGAWRSPRLIAVENRRHRTAANSVQAFSPSW